MDLQIRDGNRAEAMRQYQICKELLATELGVPPDPLTEAVLERIKTTSTEQRPVATPESIARQEMVAQRGDDQAPVLAVLPFTNLSDDPEHAYFAEGLADDLIHALSAFRWFKVLGRSSTFRVRQGEANLELMRQSFGATHLVGGQLRRAGNMLRINVELVDCSNAQHLWSARYNEPVERLFELEDDIVSQIASAIVPALELAEMKALHTRPPGSLSAYELLQRGNWHLYRNLTTADADDEASRCFDAALAIDPNYAAALAALAYVKYRTSLRHATDAARFREHLEDVRATALQALDIEPREPRALRYLGGALSLLRDQEGALRAIERSIELCPSFATAYSGLAFVHDLRGEFEAARPAADETIRLRPHDPVLHRCIMSKSIADYQMGAYEEAAHIARNSLSTSSNWWMSNTLLAASLGQQGRTSEAAEAIERIRTNYPDVTLDRLSNVLPFQEQAHVDHLQAGLIKAGWRD
jgi:adenylate cyclase